MNTMDFSAENIKKAIETIKSHSIELESIKSELTSKSVYETAQILIMEKFGDAQIEAEEIVDDIKKGIAEFDKQYAANVAHDETGIARQLESATRDKGSEERHNCYVNVLTALQLAQTDDISEETVAQRLAANSSLGDEELLAAIETAAGTCLCTETIASGVAEKLCTGDVAQLAHDLKLRKDDSRFMAAVWLYIEQRNETLKFGDTPYSAEQLGALAAAGIEAIVVTGELEEGSISLNRWQTTIKWILGALLGLALTAAVFSFSLLVSVAAISVVIDLMGTGLFAAFLALSLSVCIASNIVKDGINATDKLLEMFVGFYDTHIATITDRLKKWAKVASVWAKEMAEKARHTIEKLRNKASEALATARDSNTQNEQQGEEETAEPAVQPVMA